LVQIALIGRNSEPNWGLTVTRSDRGGQTVGVVTEECSGKSPEQVRCFDRDGIEDFGEFGCPRVDDHPDLDGVAEDVRERLGHLAG
jgi:hypothetical protein